MVALLDREGIRLMHDKEGQGTRLRRRDGLSTNTMDAGEQHDADGWRYTILSTGTYIAYKEGWLSRES